jgi:hypothetical protein
MGASRHQHQKRLLCLSLLFDCAVCLPISTARTSSQARQPSRGASRHQMTDAVAAPGTPQLHPPASAPAACRLASQLPTLPAPACALLLPPVQPCGFPGCALEQAQQPPARGPARCPAAPAFGALPFLNPARLPSKGSADGAASAAAWRCCCVWGCEWGLLLLRLLVSPHRQGPHSSLLGWAAACPAGMWVNGGAGFCLQRPPVPRSLWLGILWGCCGPAGC